VGRGAARLVFLLGPREGLAQTGASALQEQTVSDHQGEDGNAAQIDYWNATAGQTWARYQAQLDRQIEPLGLEALRALAPRPGEHVLDVGCGCGQTTLELAACVGASGAVTSPKAPHRPSSWNATPRRPILATASTTLSSRALA